jgi:tetratricopeptide (TPR) repeat protein
MRKRTTVFVALHFLLSWGLASFAEEVVPAAVHDALAGALAENPNRVSSIRELVDNQNPEEGRNSTGLSDDLAVLDILAATTSQKGKGVALKRLAGRMNDPVAKERLLNLASRVHEVELQDLIKKRRSNRVTGFFNRAWQTTSEVITGQPRALAVAGTDAFFAATGKSDPTVVDKKIAYLASLREIDGEATDQEVADGRKIVASLEEKKSRALLKHWKAAIKEARKQGEDARAIRLCRNGSTLWPLEQKWFDDQAAELAAKQAAEAAAVQPSSAIANPATVAGPEDPSMMLLRKKLADSEPRPEEISVDPARQPIDVANSERRGKTLNYLLFGDTGPGINTHGVARTVAESGSNAPAALGILQGAQTVLRGATLLFGNDLGVEKAIEAYAEVDRTTPQALSDQDRLKWADLCAKKGRFKDALDILEKHHLDDPKRKAKYRSRWGNAILKRSEDLPAGGDRFRALKFITEKLPDTSAATRAQKLLEETPSTEKALVQVTREDLKAYEVPLAQAGFNFKKEWWDGKGDNGEINEEGVYWDPDGTVWYRVGTQSAWRNVPQNTDNLPALSGLFVRIEEEGVARALAGKRSEGRKFPIEIEGATGPSSTYVTPKIVQYDIEKDEDGLFQ